MSSRLADFMEAQGFRVGPEPKFYNKFHDWSVRHQEEFYAAALKDLDFSWMKEPVKLLDYDASGPIWKAKWFVDGEANVFNACIEEQVRKGLGDKPALISYREDETKPRILTFSEVESRVNFIADHLKTDGVEKGDRVSLILPSSEEAYLIFYAIQKIGATFVPIATETRGDELAERLRMTKPKVIFSVDSYLYGGKEIEASMNLAGALQRLATEEGYAPEVVEINYLRKNSGRDPNTEVLPYHKWTRSKTRSVASTVPLSSRDATMILFTSGTTGVPKGTRHGYGALIEDMIENAYASNVRAGDRSMWYTNPGWMMWPWLITGSNALGAAAVLYDGAPSINGKDVLMGFVRESAITHLGISPSLAVSMLDQYKDGFPKDTVKSLRELRYTSEPMREDTARKLTEFGYPPSGACGGTDGCFCYCGGNPVTERNGVKMMPGLGIDVHVMSVSGKLMDVGSGSVGEVVITSPFPSMTMGLLNDDADSTRFRKAYFHRNKESGDELEYAVWFHGDLALTDRNGRMSVLRRAGDLLNVHGSKFDPVRVQETALRHNPTIKDIAPITHEGDLVLFAVPKVSVEEMGRQARENLETGIRISIQENVGFRAKASRVYFVGELPYTINQKLSLSAVRDAFEGRKVNDSTIRNKASVEEIARLGTEARSARRDVPPVRSRVR